MTIELRTVSGSAMRIQGSMTADLLSLSPADGTAETLTMIKRGNIRDVCDPEAVRLLESLLKQESADSVKIVFVYAPIYELLKQNLDEACSRSEYQKLSNQYDIPVLDFTDMWICSDTCYFQDANHLNARGADIFSRKLASYIDSLGFLTR